MKKPIVIHYLDFRRFMADFFHFLKESEAGISYKSISEQYKLGSHSHYFDIVKGRNLTPQYFAKYAQIFAFSKSDREYFELLVLYNQTKDIQLKERTLKEIVKRSPMHQTLKMDLDSKEFFSNLDNSIMLNLLAVVPHMKDHHILAKCFRPRITSVRARHALDNLKNLGFIEWKEDHWVIKNRHLQFSENSKELILRPVHLESLQLGINAYQSDYEHQQYSTLTLATSHKVKNRIHAKIAELRKEIVQWVKEEEDIETVLQVNFQTIEASAPFYERKKRKHHES